MSNTNRLLDGVTIARLIPVGRDTETAFSRVVKSNHLTEHHDQFIHAISLGSETSPADSISASDDEPDHPPRPMRDGTPKQFWAGHYLLSTDRPGDVQPSIGWRVGRQVNF